jgi:UDP-N-acetylglucosamine:LPS N-acetylglucosamine transferase
MTPTGAEHARQYSNFDDSDSSAADAQHFEDAQLAIVVAEWYRLPPNIREEIAELVSKTLQQQ